MTYIYHILRDNPIAVYSLDTGVTDSSGFNRNGSTTGTPTADRPLAARGIASQYLDAAGFTYPVTDVMMVTKHQKSFSLEAWVKPHNSIGLGNILARDSSGLYIDEGLLFFQVVSASGITAIEYPWLEVGRTAHIVGVYDTNDIYLYVNGEVVGSASVDVAGITDTTATLKTNAEDSFRMSVDSVAIYNYPLSASAIRSHYSVGTQYPSAYDISRGNGAHVYSMNPANADLKFSLDIDTDEEWADSVYTECEFVDGELLNSLDAVTDDYAAGVWEKSIAFPEEAGVILAGSSLHWTASPGVLVYTALNDDAYVLATNGSQPFAALDITTAQTLRIKVEFPAGSDQSVMKQMLFRAYTSKAIKGSDQEVGMTLSNEETTALNPVAYNPVEFSNNAGLKIVSPASISIAQDLNFGGYVAVEFTVLLEAAAISKTLFSAGTKTITTNGSGQWVPTNVTLIVDGVQISSATTIALNRWHHVIAIFTSQASAMTFLNGVNGRLGYLATYVSGMSALNLAGAQNIYNNWVGMPALQLVEANVVGITEFEVKGYSYDWAIQPAG